MKATKQRQKANPRAGHDAVAVLPAGNKPAAAPAYPIAPSLRLYRSHARRTAVFDPGWSRSSFAYIVNGERRPLALVNAARMAVAAMRERGVGPKDNALRLLLLALNAQGYVTAAYEVPPLIDTPVRVQFRQVDFSAAMNALGATDVVLCYNAPDGGDLTPYGGTKGTLEGAVAELRRAAGRVHDVVIRGEVDGRQSWVSFAGIGALIPDEWASAETAAPVPAGVPA